MPTKKIIIRLKANGLMSKKDRDKLMKLYKLKVDFEVEYVPHKKYK